MKKSKIIIIIIVVALIILILHTLLEYCGIVDFTHKRTEDEIIEYTKEYLKESYGIDTEVKIESKKRKWYGYGQKLDMKPIQRVFGAYEYTLNVKYGYSIYTLRYIDPYSVIYLGKYKKYEESFDENYIDFFSKNIERLNIDNQYMEKLNQIFKSKNINNLELYNSYIPTPEKTIVLDMKDIQYAEQVFNETHSFFIENNEKIKKEYDDIQSYSKNVIYKIIIMDKEKEKKVKDEYKDSIENSKIIKPEHLELYKNEINTFDKEIFNYINYNSDNPKSYNEVTIEIWKTEYKDITNFKVDNYKYENN